MVAENYRLGVLEVGPGLRAAARAESRDHHGAPVRLRADRADEGPAGFRRHRRIHGRPALCVGPSDRPPLRVGISIGDSIAALHGVIGAMMALRHRDATGGRWNGQAGEACRAGQGQMVDVALYEAVFNMMESLVPEYDVAGVVRERTGGALPGIVPSNTYTTRDGQNVVIAGNGDAIFRRLMRGHRPRGPGRRSRPGAQRRPRPPRRGDRRRHPAMVRRTRHRRGAGHAQTGRCARGQDLQRGRHVRRSAVPGARHDRAASLHRRLTGQAAGGGAEAVRNAWRHALDRAGIGEHTESPEIAGV